MYNNFLMQSRFLWRYLRFHKSKVAMLIGLLLVSTGVALIGPQLVAQFIDDARAGEPLDGLFRLAGLFVAVSVIEQLLRLASTYISEDVAWRSTNKLRADLFQHVMTLDLSFHQQYTAGNMVERIDGDVSEMSQFFSRMIVSLLGNSLLLLGILGFFFIQAWQIGLLYVVFSIVAVYALSRMRNVASKYWQASREANSDLQGFVEEHLLGIEDIRSRGAEAYVLNKLYQSLGSLFYKDRLANVRGAFVFSTILVTFLVALIMIFAIGAYLFSIGTISLGVVYLYYRYVEMLRDPLQRISREFEYLQRAVASLDRIEELFARESKIISGTETQLPSGAMAIEFDNVAFGYTQEQPVIHRLNFKLNAGKSLGLVGRTGSGKTTISRLCFRFYDPDSGIIRIGEHDITQVNTAQLRKRIALVTQDVQLFDASVRDNLTFFDATVNDEKILKLINDVGLREWLDNLPDGLDTVLNSGGGGLSAGQAQLLSFVRAFLQDPSIVILDEASSRLDPATEALIHESTQNLLAGRTSIIIAHRLETIRLVDEIMVLAKGRIVEHDAYQVLETNIESEFAQLLTTYQEGSTI